MSTETYQPTAEDLVIPQGWSASKWVERLRQQAASCEQIRPDLAERHRAVANAIVKAEFTSVPEKGQKSGRK